ncbi:hypothetical protein V8E53_007007, partial [Lactarius tabidus]
MADHYVGRNSLNGIKDHVLISKGLYRPLTHLQLLQAMSEQMQRICETREELDASHITNVYDTAVKHVTTELTTLLAAHAYASLSDEDKEVQRLKALDKLDDEYVQSLKSDPTTRNHTIERVVNKIHDSLYNGDPSRTAAEGRAGIEDWRDLWIHSMRDAMCADQGEEPFPLSINLTNSQITKRFGPQIRAEVKSRVAKIKANIIKDATSHLISEREAKFMDEIEKRYNTEVAARAAEVFKHKEADIAKEVMRLEKQTKEALMESANKVVHFEVTEAAKRNRRILEAKEDSDQWKLVIDIAARNKLKMVPIDTVAPTVLMPDSNPSSQESILSYLDPAPTTTEITMLEPTSHKLMDKVDEMAARKGDAGQTATASLHNPANQMDTDQSAPAPQHTTTIPTVPQDLLTVILAGITNLTNKMEGFESRLMAVEQGETLARAKPATDPRNRPAPPIPPRPTLKQGPKGILINAIPRAPPRVPPRPQPQQQPANEPQASATGEMPQSTGPEPTAPAPAEVHPTTRPMGMTEEDWNSLSSVEKKRKRNQANRNRKKAAEAARVDDPESFPPLPTTDPNPFIVVTKRAVRNQQNVSNFAAAARNAQSMAQPAARRSPAVNRNTNNNKTPTNLTTEVTIMRDGGLRDEAAERAIRTLNPEQIVMKAHTAMEQTAERPPFLLGGRWAGSANTTGNFVYIFNGTVKFETIRPFGAALIGPLKRGLMVPAQGWVWTQLRNVPVKDENGVIHDSDKLTAEVRRNAVMASATLCTLVNWQRAPTAIMGDASATALMAIVDEDGSLVRSIQANNIHMFGRQIKFVVVGDRPALIQCGRCHLLGHNTRSPLCKVPPQAVKCYRCGGPHHAQQHAFYCKGKHADARHCNCKPKCILCGNIGHHARSRQCPKRGDFRPPTLATPDTNQQGGTDDTDDLTTTQREGPPITEAGLPRKKTQKRKQPRKPRQGNQFDVLDANAVEDPAQHQNDPRNHPAYFLPESGITGWDDGANDNNFTEIPEIELESWGPSLEPPAPPVTGRALHRSDKIQIVDID